MMGTSYNLEKTVAAIYKGICTALSIADWQQSSDD